MTLDPSYPWSLLADQLRIKEQALADIAAPLSDAAAQLTSLQSAEADINASIAALQAAILQLGGQAALDSMKVPT
jgi:hypothetical protein